MADLPEPLTPPECDLRKSPWMPLNISVLKGSRSWMRCKRDPALAFYLINLWSASWHQLPAASLEDDDDYLCDLAQCAPKAWSKVRELVLSGWVKCSDGRLYHPYVAEEALKSYALLLRGEEKREKDRERLQIWRDAKAAKQAATKAADAATIENSSCNQAPATIDETSDETRTKPGRNAVETSITVQDITRQDITFSKEERVCTAKAAPTTRGHRLPEDWQPDQKLQDYAIEHGRDPVVEAERFRNHYHSAAGRHGLQLRWDLTFKKWCLSDYGKSKPASKSDNGFTLLGNQHRRPVLEQREFSHD